MTLRKTESLAEYLERYRAPFFMDDPLATFETNPIREVRERCLEAIERGSLSANTVKCAEDLAERLVHQRDPLWQEFLRTLLYATRRLYSIHALQFFLQVCPTAGADQRFRSKTLYHFLDFALDQHNLTLHEAHAYIRGELRAFYIWCSRHHFYQDDEWYRLERVVKLIIKGGGYTHVRRLRAIIRLYHDRGEKQLRVGWTGNGNIPNEILREQHLVFLKAAVRHLEREHRKSQPATNVA